jgi:hypothetical protein
VIEYHDDVEDTPETLLDRFLRGGVVLVVAFTLFMGSGAIFKACASNGSNDACATDEVRRCGCDDAWTTLGYQRCHDGVWGFCDCEEDAE